MWLTKSGVKLVEKESLEKKLKGNYDRDGIDWISAATAPSSAVDRREAGIQLLQKMESGEEHPRLPHPLAVGQPAPDQSGGGVHE